MFKVTNSSVVKSVLKRCANDQRGGVAIIFALTLVPVLGMAGASVDYGNASSTRARLGQASDAAALAAARTSGLTKTERDKVARDVFNANMGANPITGVNFVVKDIASGIRVEASAGVTTNFISIIGINTMPVSVVTEVKRGEGFVEVALVLDNTYSMVNDIPGLKKASTNFINTMFSVGAEGESLRMGVIPYVAAVNPGRTNLGMSSIDYEAKSTYHASVLREKPVALMANCDPKWGGGGGGGNDGPGSGGSGAWMQDKLNKMASIGHELFGIKSASAKGETANTVEPMSGNWYSPPRANAPAGTKAFVPTKFSTPWNPCQLVGPNQINHLDLFDRIPGAQWKGCVEARPEPHDITETAPSESNANTRFVPYFWPDEPGAKGGASEYNNNYMNDNPVPAGWQNLTQWHWESLWTILKYNGVNTATMNDDLGPNKGCPDELQRLTTSKVDLLKKIDNMKAYKGGGGTISSEGVAWGWRVLSPNMPFADGKDYGKAKKFIVLMSDGENSIGENVKSGPVYSLYNAYGYLSEGRFGAQKFSQATKYLDDRFKKVCENAKTAGVTVMTVYFRDSNSSAKEMMKKCATSGKFFYEAVDEKALDTAFQSIAAEIGKIRITK